MAAGDGRPPRRLHGRRRGRKLRPGLSRLLDDVLPRRLLTLPETGTLDPDRLFDRPVSALRLEVGFGAGEHLAWQAGQAPTVGFIGCEPFLNGVATLLRAAEEADLDNIRIHPGDARDVIDRLPDRCLDRCFVLFPDPWPKRRHHGRRFIGQETLDTLARVMAPGAELRLASDDPGLIDWMLWQTRTHGAFTWLARRPADFRARSADWPETRYEAKRLKGTPGLPAVSASVIRGR